MREAETRTRRDGGLTFPTKSCVRVSRGGFVVRAGEPLDAMAIWMTASMSSLVGPEPAGGDPEVELAWSPAR